MQERTRIAGADRHGSVIEIHDVAVAVGIGRIEQGKLLHAHGILELGKVAGEAHFPELFEHARAVEGGDRADEPGGSASRCRLLHARMPRRIWSRILHIRDSSVQTKLRGAAGSCSQGMIYQSACRLDARIDVHDTCEPIVCLR